MSLAKIAKVKTRKRRYGVGGDTDGGADQDVGGNTGGPGPSGPSTGGSTVGFSGSNNDDTADRVSEITGPGTNFGEYGTPAEFDLSQISAPGLTGLLGERGQQIAATLGGLGALGKVGAVTGINSAIGKALAEREFNGGISAGGSGAAGNARDSGSGGGGDGSVNNAAVNPFGSDVPTQTTPADGSTGMRKYVWDPVARQYTLTNVGAGDNPMGYTQGQTFKMAAGGPAPSGIAAGAPMGPRFVTGGGTGLSDDVPVQMDDGGEGRLADGEFVIPADVVSGLGGGSSKAGADILYQMMERIRQQAHGSKQQIRPVDPQQVMPA